MIYTFQKAKTLWESKNIEMCSHIKTVVMNQDFHQRKKKSELQGRTQLEGKEEMWSTETMDISKISIIMSSFCA